MEPIKEVLMNIGEAARASGVSAKMLRHYESIGLIPHAGRTDAGYRTYSPSDVETLRFIRRARDFGMPMTRIKLLVGLWQDKDRPSREVKDIATQQITELDARIKELTIMKDALAALAEACHGDSRPDCPILSDLAGISPLPPHTSRSSRTPTIGHRFEGNRETVD
jgi:MerR family transcriptional regulator, copper efflux regulator